MPTMTLRNAILVTSAWAVQASTVFSWNDDGPFNPFGSENLPDSALLEQGVSILSSVALRNSTTPLSVKLDGDLNVVLGNSTAVIASSTASAPDQGASIANSSLLADAVRDLISKRKDISLHSASSSLEQAGQHLMAQLADNAGKRWDSFADHLVPPPGVAPDVEAAMEDASELAYQLSTIESVVKQANDEFVHSQLSALLQVRNGNLGDSNELNSKGSMAGILGPGLGKRQTTVDETQLNKDIVYQGNLNLPHLLKTVPRPMATRSMFSIFRDLIADVNSQWLNQPEQGTGYMDAYLHAMDSNGTNAELKMGDSDAYNWYYSKYVKPANSELTTTWEGLSKAGSAAQSGSLLQSLSLVGRLKRDDPRWVAVSLAQGLAVHSEYAHLRDSVHTVGNFLQQLSGEGSSRAALDLYEGLLHESQSAIESLEHVCLMLFKTHDLPRPHPAF